MICLRQVAEHMKLFPSACMGWLVALVLLGLHHSREAGVLGFFLYGIVSLAGAWGGGVALRLAYFDPDNPVSTKEQGDWSVCLFWAGGDLGGQRFLFQKIGVGSTPVGSEILWVFICIGLGIWEGLWDRERRSLKR